MTEQKITAKEKQFLISVLNKYKAEEAKILAEFEETLHKADKEMNAVLEGASASGEKVDMDALEKKLQDL